MRTSNRRQGSNAIIVVPRLPSDLEAQGRLRSASTSSLIVRCTRLSTVGDRAFSIAAPRVWNELHRSWEYPIQ